MSAYVTRIELSKNGTRTVYHRNGNARGNRVSKAWTHRDTPEERQLCEACITK